MIRSETQSQVMAVRLLVSHIKEMLLSCILFLRFDAFSSAAVLTMKAEGSEMF